MAISQRTPISASELMRRLAVTLGALAAYRLGAYVPLAGIDQTALLGLYQAGGSILAVERLSVVALGVMPMIGALLLVELARLLSRRFNAWAGASADNARRLERYVLVGSLLLAAVQAYGLAVALENASGLVAEPGLSFRLMVVVTLVAGTAVLMWLAALISRHGLGGGVWLLLVASHLAGLPHLAYAMLDAVQTGTMALSVPVVLLAYTVAAVAAVGALALTLVRSMMPLDRTLIWPLFIAALPVDALAAAPWLLPASPIRDGLVALLTSDAPLYLAAVAAIVVAISLAQWRRAKPLPTPAAPCPPPAEVASASPMLLTALTLAAIAVVPSLLTTHMSAPLLVDGRWVTAAVVVALPVVDMLLHRPASGSP